MNNLSFFLYLFVMAGVTYLIRVAPFVLVREEIQNAKVKAFLDYVPYAVLAAMTVPAVFTATSNVYSAAAGFVTALIMALRDRSLLTVALCSCVMVFVVEYVMTMLI